MLLDALDGSFFETGGMQDQGRMIEGLCFVVTPQLKQPAFPSFAGLREY